MHPIWKQHRTLAWSNSNADDSTRIRCALLRPRFHRMLDICGAFGLERVQKEWAILEADELSKVEVNSARRIVERILSNIEEGYRRAEA